MPDSHALAVQLLAEQQKTNQLLLAILSALTEDDGQIPDEGDEPQYLNARG